MAMALECDLADSVEGEIDLLVRRLEMGRISEYEVENLFIDRLESIGYEYIELKNYDNVLENFKNQLAVFNKDKLIEKKEKAEFSKAEFFRIVTFVENKTVYESAKLMRDKYILVLDNGETVYLDFFSSDTTRNIYQVAHQITMDKEKEDCYRSFFQEAVKRNQSLDLENLQAIGNNASSLTCSLDYRIAHYQGRNLTMRVEKLRIFTMVMCS